MNRIVLPVLLAVMVLMGCAREQPYPLQIGTNVWPGYEPLYLARELNYLDKTDAKLVEFTSTSEVIRAFQNGTIDAAGLTLDEAIQLLSIGADIKIVLVMDVSHGADAILAQPGINSMQELKSRRVGYEATAVGAYMLSRALQVSGMNLTQISAVPVERERHENVFIGKKVDAIVTFDPVRTRLLAAGAMGVFDSSQIPGEIVDVLAVRNKAANDKSVHLQQVLKSWFMALEYLRKNQVQAARIMSIREGLSTEDFLASLQGLRFPDIDENNRLLGGKAPGLLATGQRLAVTMSESGLIQDIPIIQGVLDNNHLLEARQ